MARTVPCDDRAVAGDKTDRRAHTMDWLRLERLYQLKTASWSSRARMTCWILLCSAIDGLGQCVDKDQTQIS
jgi:hypothetical protein